MSEKDRIGQNFVVFCVLIAFSWGSLVGCVSPVPFTRDTVEVPAASATVDSDMEAGKSPTVYETLTPVAPEATNSITVLTLTSSAFVETSTSEPTSTSTPCSTDLPLVYSPTSCQEGVDETPEPEVDSGERSLPEGIPRLVLANYFPWYDPATWETGCTTEGDLPAIGPYDSDDESVLGLHIDQARRAGLDGFAVHWFAAGDRTNENFVRLLKASPEGFSLVVTFLNHILPGATEQDAIYNLNYLLETYVEHPRYLRFEGKPLILFSDMYRVPDYYGKRPSSDADVELAVERWKAIRQMVDPDHRSLWIAEGLRSEYLAVFDGLYVYRIDHACCPEAYLGAPRWADQVRMWEEQTGLNKLWIGTVMPGWDDRNSGADQCADLRVSAEHFVREREDGDYYARTWEAVLATDPDLILLHSFNEWVEGSYIEPSVRYGDFYLRLTAEWAEKYRSEH